MPTIQQSIVAIPVTVADPAAAPAGSNLPMNSLPDTADVAGILMPFAGAIVGLSVQGSPASGDTVTVVPQVSAAQSMSTPTACSDLSLTITNAVPSASAIVSKDAAAEQFAAGQFINLKYTTTTGGTYTARDLAVVLYISTGREDV